MKERIGLLCLIFVTAGCSGGGNDGTGGSGGDAGDPLLVELFPVDGATEVSVAARVTAEISRAEAEICRFSQTNTTFEVTDDNGDSVDGSLVFFVEGMRVDFTLTGLFGFDKTYTAEVKLECSQLATATFTTRAASASAVIPEVGAGFRIIDLVISEPGPLSSLLKQFLDDANLIVQVLDADADSLRMIGGEGRPVSDFDGTTVLTDPFLIAFVDNSFLFPMNGVFKAPYFQIEGSLHVPVGNALDEDIVLERFEISGRFIENGDGDLEIIEAAIRASSRCDDVCNIQDDDLALICANRTTICDENDDLNLIGTYYGAPNDIASYQQITLDNPTDGAVDVPLDSIIAISLTKEVIPSTARAVIVQLDDGSGAGPIEIPCTPAGNGLSATCPLVPDPQPDPPVPALLAATEYIMLVVAHAAAEFSFTTP